MDAAALRRRVGHVGDLFFSLEQTLDYYPSAAHLEKWAASVALSADNLERAKAFYRRCSQQSELALPDASWSISLDMWRPGADGTMFVRLQRPRPTAMPLIVCANTNLSLRMYSGIPRSSADTEQIFQLNPVNRNAGLYVFNIDSHKPRVVYYSRFWSNMPHDCKVGSWASNDLLPARAPTASLPLPDAVVPKYTHYVAPEYVSTEAQTALDATNNDALRAMISKLRKTAQQSASKYVNAQQNGHAMRPITFSFAPKECCEFEITLELIPLEHPDCPQQGVSYGVSLSQISAPYAVWRDVYGVPDRIFLNSLDDYACMRPFVLPLIVVNKHFEMSQLVASTKCVAEQAGYVPCVIPLMRMASRILMALYPTTNLESFETNPAANASDLLSLPMNDVTTAIAKFTEPYQPKTKSQLGLRNLLYQTTTLHDPNVSFQKNKMFTAHLGCVFEAYLSWVRNQDLAQITVSTVQEYVAQLLISMGQTVLGKFVLAELMHSLNGMILPNDAAYKPTFAVVVASELQAITYSRAMAMLWSTPICMHLYRTSSVEVETYESFLRRGLAGHINIKTIDSGA